MLKKIIFKGLLSLFAKNKRFFGAAVNIKLDESRLFDQRST